jgi:hypothetical protein
MEKYFLTFLLAPFVLFAQNDNPTTVDLFKVNILNPGITYEKSLSKNTTLCLDANLSFGVAIHENHTIFLTVPYLRGQYRYYYNLDKRISKGKDVSRNSGGFIALNTSYYLSPIGNDTYISNYDGFTLGGVWGFQKTYKSGFNLGATAGLGNNFSSNQVHKVMPILNFTIGWVIGK